MATVYTYTGDVINSLHWCASSCAVSVLFWVNFISHCYALIVGYLEIKLKTEQVASDCRLPRKHAFVQLSTNFSKSIPTMAYQTFFYQTWSCILICYTKTGPELFITYMQQLKEMINCPKQKVVNLEQQNNEVLMLAKAIREQQRKDARKNFAVDNSPYKVSN